ncbi:MAG: helix-turn-helix transcriptional regulator [Candidatus Ornithospirochaeta sp.]|nr:helix-turn-helix transcriptional regulator [Candidatus Ornithospirochaeta sp.]
MTCEILRDLKHLYQKANADSVSCNYFDIRRKGEWNPSLETLQRILDSVGIDFFSFFSAVENDMDIEKCVGTSKGYRYSKRLVFKAFLSIMEEKGISKLALARLMEKDPSAVCRYFRDNDYRSVTMAYIEDVCKALDISVSALIARYDGLFNESKQDRSRFLYF